ncbi:MAG: hypothetical protein JWL67_2211 [Solirubrobacterales bacterium]|jgi:hypothetical protein|nr:hypothetical protein [Solirubrobacterales bacterium]
MLGACASAPAADPSDHPPRSFVKQSSHALVNRPTLPSATTGQTGIAAAVKLATRIYERETKGTKLRRETTRISRDAILLSSLSRGDLAGAQAEADSQLTRPSNHFAHVTRISVVRGARVLVNATLNSDGVYVVAPATRALRLHGRPLGTLLVSIQDVTGFVKLVHHITGADVAVRGASGHVRASLGAAAAARLPTSGQVTLAERRYRVRSFREPGWEAEPLTVWLLVGA